MNGTKSFVQNNKGYILLQFLPDINIICIKSLFCNSCIFNVKFWHQVNVYITPCVLHPSFQKAQIYKARINVLQTSTCSPQRYYDSGFYKTTSEPLLILYFIERIILFVFKGQLYIQLQSSNKEVISIDKTNVQGIENNVRQVYPLQIRNVDIK